MKLIRSITCILSVTALAAVALAQGPATGSSLKKWTPGKGWGWVWEPSDEVGALNEMTDASRLAALRVAKSGRVFDLGVTYDRNSFKWAGHSPGEIMTFRSPEGIKRQGDFAPAATDPRQTTWHSCASFISEFHYLEDLAKERAYEFTYIGTSAKIRGTAAGFALRPIAIR